MNSRPLFIVFLCALFILLLGAPFTSGRFYIHGRSLSPQGVELLLAELTRAEKALGDLFAYQPSENFDVVVLASVEEMKALFGLGPWIGAYYENFKSYLQPVEVLVRREVLERVVLIEYAHYFVDSYTNMACPAWLNEMCSYYFYHLCSGRPWPAAPVSYGFKTFSEFSDLKSNMRDYERMQAFYYYSLSFCDYLKTQRQVSIFPDLLKAMHEGKSFTAGIKAITGKSIDHLFEKEFLQWHGQG